MLRRQEAFKAKFAEAAKQLGVTVHDIVSLKMRDNVSAHHEYRALLETLQREVGLHTSPLSGNYQGNGHLVERNNTAVIVVEHETGLEILYIAGSLASIISLIPLVLRCWRAIRGHSHGPRHPSFDMLEVRRIDGSGHLVEEHVHGMGSPWSEPVDFMNQALFSAAEHIDGDIQQLKKIVENLLSRVKAVEQALAEKTKPRKSKGTKKRKG